MNVEIGDLILFKVASTNTGTPGSDFLFLVPESQINFGRNGNDILLGFDPGTDNSKQQQIDIFIGDLGEEELLPYLQDTLLGKLLEQLPILGDYPLVDSPRDWNNRFILGDWKQPYYVGGQGLNLFGLNQFAVILDFNPRQDIIQLHGTSEDYLLIGSPLGTAIFWQQETGPDLIAFLPVVSDFSLEGDYFQFEGDTPPQGPVLGETQQLGTVGIDITTGSATDSFGNVYVAGETSGSLGGDNAGSYDVWVVKYDSNGNQQWLQQFGSSSLDAALGIATDNEGNSYLAGVTTGDLAATNQGLEFYDVWLAKYDSDGNQLWIQQFGTEVVDATFAIDVDDDGNVYLSGYTIFSDEEEAQLAKQFKNEPWVAKYDSDGNQLWFRDYGATGFDESYGGAVGSDGIIYTTGWTVGNFGGENAGAYDVWIAKHDNNGQLAWVEQFGSEDYEFPWGIDTDSEGNVYATGWTLGDLGEENAGSYDAWLAKYDSDGNQLWIQQFGTGGDDGFFLGGMEIDSNSNIFLTGYTDNNLGGPNAGSYDVWVANYDSDGNQLWIQQFGTPKLDYTSDVTADNSGHLYVTGYTEGSFGDTNAGSLDGWIAKLDAKSGKLEDFTGTSEPVTENAPLIIGNSDEILVGDFEDDILTEGIGANANSFGVEESKTSALAEFPTTDALTALTTRLNQAVPSDAETLIGDDPLTGSVLTPGLDFSVNRFTII